MTEIIVIHGGDVDIKNDMISEGIRIAGQRLMEAIDSSNRALQDLTFVFRSAVDFDEMRRFNDFFIMHENGGQCYHPTHGNECQRLWVNPSTIHTSRAKTRPSHALTGYTRRQNMRRRKFKQFDFNQEAGT